MLTISLSSHFFCCRGRVLTRWCASYDKPSTQGYLLIHATCDSPKRKGEVVEYQKYFPQLRTKVYPANRRYHIDKINGTCNHIKQMLDTNDCKMVVNSLVMDNCND